MSVEIKYLFCTILNNMVAFHLMVITNEKTLNFVLRRHKNTHKFCYMLAITNMAMIQTPMLFCPFIIGLPGALNRNTGRCKLISCAWELLVGWHKSMASLLPT
jgi:hypothetical protein